MTPRLSVVIGSIGGANPEATAASVTRSAELAGASVEVVLVWQAAPPPPALSGDSRVVVLPPLGLSHARNEGYRHAGGPCVAFLDDDETVDEGYVAALL